MVLGWLVDFPWVSSLIVTNVSLVSSGICVLAFPACEDFAGFISVALMLGDCTSYYKILNAGGKVFTHFRRVVRLSLHFADIDHPGGLAGVGRPHLRLRASRLFPRGRFHRRSSPRR